MNLETFTRAREASWRELDALATAAETRGQGLDADRALRLGALYREAAADLALARRRFPNDPVRRRLEDLVRRSSAIVYRGRARRASLREFFATTYWQRIAERPAAVWLAALLLLAPALLAGLWAAGNPAAGLDFIPEEFRGATDPPRSDGNSAAQETAFSVFLFTNNIRVTMLAFALGITAGIGTAIVLAFNGLLLGAVTGVAIEAGNGRAFLEFIIPHGPIELSCVVIGAAAGLRLGWAIANPGELPRSRAVAVEGRRSVELVLGTMPWLVAAGLSEAFVRGSGLPLAGLATIGLGLFVAFWGLVYTRGRPAAARARGELEAERSGAGPLRAAPSP